MFGKKARLFATAEEGKKLFAKRKKKGLLLPGGRERSPFAKEKITSINSRKREIMTRPKK